MPAEYLHQFDGKQIDVEVLPFCGRGNQKIINLLEVPVARWSRAEQEYADSVIRQHFEEDR